MGRRSCSVLQSIGVVRELNVRHIFCENISVPQVKFSRENAQPPQVIRELEQCLPQVCQPGNGRHRLKGKIAGPEFNKLLQASCGFVCARTRKTSLARCVAHAPRPHQCEGVCTTNSKSPDPPTYPPTPLKTSSLLLGDPMSECRHVWPAKGFGNLKPLGLVIGPQLNQET